LSRSRELRGDGKGTYVAEGGGFKSILWLDRDGLSA